MPNPAPNPRMHGLAHVPGGPDPIPGIGGAVEWEDVGETGGGGLTPDYQSPMVIYKATSMVSLYGGSGTAPVWNPTPYASFFPEGPFVVPYTADPDGKSLRHAVVGTYLATFWFHSNTWRPFSGYHFWQPNGDIIPPSTHAAKGDYLPGDATSGPPTVTMHSAYRVPAVGGTIAILWILGTLTFTPTDANASLLIQQLAKG